jgi:two-component sensor histidine kinase
MIRVDAQEVTMFGQSTVQESAVLLTPLHLVEEINHRVVNEYSEAIASLSLAASRAANETTKQALASAAERLRDHAESHRALLPPPTQAGTNLADYIGRICNAFAQSTLAEREVLLVLDATDVVLPADRCWRIGLVIAELIRNAARHGLKGRSGRISVHLAVDAGQLICLVRDTGRPTVAAIPGRGQRLVLSLVDDLGGCVEWTFAPDGARTLVRLPLHDNLHSIEATRSDAQLAGEVL